MTRRVTWAMIALVVALMGVAPASSLAHDDAGNVSHLTATCSDPVDTTLNRTVYVYRDPQILTKFVGARSTVTLNGTALATCTDDDAIRGTSFALGANIQAGNDFVQLGIIRQVRAVHDIDPCTGQRAVPENVLIFGYTPDSLGGGHFCRLWIDIDGNGVADPVFPGWTYTFSITEVTVSGVSKWRFTVTASGWTGSFTTEIDRHDSYGYEVWFGSEVDNDTARLGGTGSDRASNTKPAYLRAMRTGGTWMEMPSRPTATRPPTTTGR